MWSQRRVFVCHEASLYKIPPRDGARGHVSGQWMIDDRIFNGTIIVLENKNDLEIRFEDVDGQLFAAAPVPAGQTDLVVEPAVDSSRNYALRIEDPESKRHAFVGLSMPDRASSLEFKIALADHDKRQVGEKAGALPSGSGIGALQNKEDLSLKDGQKITLQLKTGSIHGVRQGYESRLKDGNSMVRKGPGVGSLFLRSNGHETVALESREEESAAAEPEENESKEAEPVGNPQVVANSMDKWIRF